MLAVFKRDFGAFYKTPIGYTFSGIMILFINLTFYFLNVQSGIPDVKPVFFISMFGLAFIVPVLTMRLLSEEYKQKTDQLLLTSSLKVSSIVLGKYFAALFAFVMTLVGTLVIPLILAAYDALEPVALIGNYVALIVAAGSFISIGLFISALTENQLISALISWAVFIGIFLSDTFVRSLDILWLTNVFNWFSIFNRYNSFTLGLFSAGDIIFYLSISVVFLFLTTRVIEKKRYS